MSERLAAHVMAHCRNEASRVLRFVPENLALAEALHYGGLGRDSGQRAGEHLSIRADVNDAGHADGTLTGWIARAAGWQHQQSGQQQRGEQPLTAHSSHLTVSL